MKIVYVNYLLLYGQRAVFQGRIEWISALTISVPFSRLSLLFYHEDGSSRSLRNVGNDVPDTVSAVRTPDVTRVCYGRFVWNCHVFQDAGSDSSDPGSRLFTCNRAHGQSIACAGHNARRPSMASIWGGMEKKSESAIILFSSAMRNKTRTSRRPASVLGFLVSIVSVRRGGLSGPRVCIVDTVRVMGLL